MRKHAMLLPVICIIILLSMSQTIFAQSPMSLSGSVGGGLLVPQSSNLKGNIYSTYDYPLSKTGYDINGKIHFGLPVLPFAIVGIVSYNSLSDNAIIPVTITSPDIINSKFNTSLSILSVGVGIEYTIIPTPIIKPYIGANAVMNFISGKENYDNNIIPESKLNSTSRFGLDLGVGTLIDIPILPFSLDVEAKYRFANLSGKKFVDYYGIPGFGGISQTPTYNLNDAKNLNDPKDHDRSINYFTITLGLTFKIL